ncbi:Mucin-associated surface protein (MASP) [Trypanosoma cruzi]|uniref:Mucin-associated surface protein (MASP), putative n=2 Tax=Trypanosoma cruzi TaxID=5693 RepID=Q4E040_TRYCC|nr:mucin-associated surface protein (MASP), putative [Trypanosoma cruzi]EAN98146.1 mucin-associated surface protein (MASP), putative [Trypanosoma cruzi]KAF5218028.1 Mucin-associated surface protein (MASP) subgroup S104 [Trypanosoma cruzi]KAF8303678.1 Mucin-associated surface protein (MASP), subgroup S104 [Trypanosoma cruzi]PWV19860.1 Mucin-associated surface protein (MASP) [Trypanosoma cruzi]|eukprot:XP_819997.1 mucin-associated surface protein (MASP) [Trypanosoma cruzi strain CL Brener]
MAMMMTGRVLLVCALCVLWCSSAVQAADGLISDGSLEGENMVLTWYPVNNKTCEERSTNGGKLDESAFKSCMHELMNEVCEAYYSMKSSESHVTEADSICGKYTGDPSEEDVQTSTPQEQPSPEVETPVASQTPETSKVEAAEMGSPPGVPAGDSPANPTEGPQSTSDATDTANNEAEKSSTEVMPKNAPESNATRKEEEKRNEKNHSNTKETPVDAEAKKNNTKTTDSDGSTAVSHTTSPLLPLLVACAAAAAVVAA